MFSNGLLLLQHFLCVVSPSVCIFTSICAIKRIIFKTTNPAFIARQHHRPPAPSLAHTRPYEEENPLDNHQAKSTQRQQQQQQHVTRSR
uniref:Putative secreted protein n=1 Tax=Anopheles darlingi TaxID=43151 RepID=A0A2M4DDN4_ANODA